MLVINRESGGEEVIGPSKLFDCTWNGGSGEVIKNSVEKIFNQKFNLIDSKHFEIYYFINNPLVDLIAPLVMNTTECLKYIAT